MKLWTIDGKARSDDIYNLVSVRKKITKYNFIYKDTNGKYYNSELYNSRKAAEHSVKISDFRFVKVISIQEVSFTDDEDKE